MAQLQLSNTEPVIEGRADCKKCGGAMLFVASTPCLVNSHMEKCTYFCFDCGRIKTFALQKQDASPSQP